MEIPRDVIIRDSIIENKERTKNYWEQLMMAASDTNGNMRVWDTPDAPSPNSNTTKSFRNSYNVTLNSVSDSSNDKLSDYIETDSTELMKNRSNNILSMEDRIALELQEQKEREDELRRLRKQLSIDSGKEIFSVKDVSTEELSSIHTNDDSTFSEYGSEEKQSLDGNNSRVNTPHSEDFVHRRTQSLDSVSSGHSSGSASFNDRDRDSPRKKISVRPYEDPQEEEELPTYKRIENETPIEREIRISREREEELRKEKGITVGNPKVEQVKIQKNFGKKDAVKNDTRDVQHRIATNRIQQEIEEANERENELRTEGKILTTSEERVDAKVTRFTQLAEFAILENRHNDSRMKRSLSVSHLMVPDSSQDNLKRNHQVNVTSLNGTKRFTPNPSQKAGIMQRFIAGKGRLSFPQMNSDNEFVTDKPIRRPLGRSLTGLDVNTAVRKGYIPAGEKIQEELKEMEKREEELRLQRALNPVSTNTYLHRSQPNLLNISDDEGGEEHHSWTSHKEHQKPVSRLTHSASNPHLLDDSLEKVNIRLSNKRFSLLEQWESRIQGAQ
ncbi:hypothetical protein RUM44_013227 [Polyplax serrata]|uniref:A-kinase anchor protein 2 C-terminal domain-containing protein n=1 Tax=Polyplax serrata TaxID=468196 RepID=A0ABR1BFR8_POLSC